VRSPSKPHFPEPPTWVAELTSVGVTGTNGKTSTTRLLAAALGSIARPALEVTTVGTALGGAELAVAKSYQGTLAAVRTALDRGARFAALEVTSEVLALGFAQRWPFHAGVFTNLTHDHLDAHGSPEHYFASKAQLFHSLKPGGVAVVNGCDEVAELLCEVIAPSVTTLSYGIESRGAPQMPLDARAEVTGCDFEGTSLAVTFGERLGERTLALRTRAVGDIFGENALAALVAACALGASPEAAADAIAAAPAPRGRFERVLSEPNVVVDYAHTPDALRRTLMTARRLTTSGSVSVVFGAGGNRDREKRPAMGAAAGLADRVFITSDNPRSEDPRQIADAIAAAVPAGVALSVDLDREHAIATAVRSAGPGDVVVIAGKGHETEQHIGTERRAFSDADAARRAIER
jgi:UDP-N-acetylmuramoyl-L-alanyl-D-glutamate--2,6-diaminopimelate ligase